MHNGLGQGREASRTFLKRETAIREEIDSAIRAAVEAKNNPPEPVLESAAVAASDDSSETEDES